MTATLELTSCPVCGDAHAAEIAGRDAIREELADLWLFHTRRMRPTAEPSDFTDRVAFSQAPPVRVARCASCTHLYRNPRENAITGIYDSEVVDDTAMRSLHHAQRSTFRTQVRRLERFRPQRGSGIEVGSYVGAFLAAARETHWHFEGVDVNEGAVAFARALNFTVTHGTVEDIAEDRRFGVVAFWNCFEQLDDPVHAARTAAHLLEPGGLMTIRVPNGDYWRRLRRHLRGPLRPIARAALAQNNLLSFPYRNGFTPSSLRTLVERAGFDVLRIYRGFSLPVSAAGAPSWSTAEARAVHALVRATQRVTGAPWIELYARRRDG